jgi:hypothetical protein
MTARTKAGAVITVVVAIAAGAAWYFFAPSPPGDGGFAFVRSVPGERATIWAVGDGADGTVAARGVVARIKADRPDRLLYLGDVYERGTEGEFRDHYETTYGPLAPITAPTPGNHDWPRHTSGYDPYWSNALKRPRTAAWYSFRAGGWTILSLDSETDHDRGSPQERWLRAHLLKPGTCRLAFWHRPRYNAGTHHGDAADMAPIWDALRGKAAIVVTGHEHSMQRLRPIDGITSFVSGAGGHGHYRLRRDDPRIAFGDDRRYGALRLRLRRGEARYAYVASNGDVLDGGTIACRPLQAATP